MDNLINLTPLFEAVIKLIFALVAIKILPLLREKLDDAQEARLANIVHIAVYAAEKLYGSGHGEQKLSYAEFLIRDKFGIKIDMNTLVAMINAEIKQMELLEMPETEIDTAPEVGAEDDPIDTEA